VQQGVGEERPRPGAVAVEHVAAELGEPRPPLVREAPHDLVGRDHVERDRPAHRHDREFEQEVEVGGVVQEGAQRMDRHERHDRRKDDPGQVEDRRMGGGTPDHRAQRPGERRRIRARSDIAPYVGRRSPRARPGGTPRVHT
jgi:hypothetical protein